MSSQVSLPARLSELRPDAIALLLVANECARVTVDPDLLSLLEISVETLIGDGPLALDTLPRDDFEITAAHRIATAFAEQFIIDVSGITEADRESLAVHFPGESMREFVTALYILECTFRLSLVARMLLGDGSGRSEPIPLATATTTGNEHQSIRQSLKDYQDAVVRGSDLDAVTTELVRLRCARTHNCRICQTLRLADAHAAGANDMMTAKVDFFEHSDLDESHKLVLRITDALITRPDTLTEETILSARANYTPAQLAELCLDITKWSTQKIHVALGTDGADTVPKNEQGVSFFGFDYLGQVTGYSATPS
jgi:alkylhydroperoxidase family enzyme